MTPLTSSKKLSDFDYELPKELIAQDANPARSHARLMVLNRVDHSISHRQFFQIEDYFEKGDVLVLNDTKVVPARIFAKRKSGAHVEILLLKKEKNAWKALIKPSGRIQEKEIIVLAENSEIELEVMDSPDGQTGIRTIRFLSDHSEKILEQYGHVPLPPYIDRKDSPIDRELYQTVFAKRPGAVASPTAGLHFDEALLSKLESKGVEILYVTLHVSYGTFQPVNSEDLSQHEMYAEYCELSDEVSERINFAKSDGRRIIACGTTAMRTLESCATDSIPSEVRAFEGMTNLFIYPPHEFKIIDAMITNFHLPKTTLLMLASAFSGHEFLMKAYQEAISQKYRFYSYGDAMLIL